MRTLLNIISITLLATISFSCTRKNESPEAKINPNWLYLLTWQEVRIEKNSDNIEAKFDSNFVIKKIDNELYNVFIGSYKGTINYTLEGKTFKIDTIKTKYPPKNDTPQFYVYVNDKNDALIVEADLFCQEFDSIFGKQPLPKFYDYQASVHDKDKVIELQSDTSNGYLTITKFEFDSIVFKLNSYELRPNIKLIDGHVPSMRTLLGKEYTRTFLKKDFESWINNLKR